MEILEVGSYDVNGSVRKFFEGCKTYIGADLAQGPGVDLVKAGHEIDFEDNSFDMTISCECFEHNPFWLQTFQNMTRMTKPNGLVVLTCASRGRLEHGTRRTSPECSPGTQSTGMDYYRNLSSRDFTNRLDLREFFDVFRFYYCLTSKDLYFFGVKRGNGKFSADFASFDREVKRIKYLNPNMEPLTVRRFLSSLHTKYPLLTLSYILPDSAYQTFALQYPKIKSKIKKLVAIG